VVCVDARNGGLVSGNIELGLWTRDLGNEFRLGEDITCFGRVGEDKGEKKRRWNQVYGSRNVAMWNFCLI
jgi:hypothetical protein